MQAIAFVLSVLLFSSSIAINLDYAEAESPYPQKFVSDRLLIKFNDDIPAYQQKGILNQNDATVSTEISQIDVLIITVPEQSLETIESSLQNNPAVEYVERDWLLEPQVFPDDPLFSDQWHLKTIGADKAWDITKGDSAPIAILDTGIETTHQDLSIKLQNGWNFYDDNSDLTDVCGHGTKVAGAAAAVTNNANGISGVAWNNPIIPIKITDPSCLGYYSAMTQGIVYAADNGAKAANISFRIFNGDVLTDAAQYMHSKGGWVVAAGGNTGNFENYPENPYIISVAATYSSDITTSFSSHGPYIDFAAPGSGIYTTNIGNSYGSASGTSFSSPITAGAIALVFASNSTLSSDDVYTKLRYSAVDLGESGRDDKYGWGRIDVGSAIGESAPVIDDTSPNVSITDPDNEADVSGVFSVNVDSSDNVQVDKVELYINAVLHQQDTTAPYSFSVDSSQLNSGSNQIQAKAVDTSGNFSIDQISINVPTDDLPPTITITNPSDGQLINGKTMISVSASDESGIKKVELFINGSLEASYAESSFTHEWNPKGASGSQIITASATDNNGNVAQTSIEVFAEKGNDKNEKGNGKPQGKK